MYNKIRLGIMLIGFATVIVVALSYSGNVSDSCRAEWNFDKSNERLIKEKLVTEESNAVVYNPGKTIGRRLPEFDLMFPTFLFGL
jgi:hypothetical protein